ncbi:MAG: hypothetical protein CMP12_09435 [Zunongwangia sp.]|jgi:hypothetical protein|uniref:hypothetical protein n=1 Tax=Zunongwangia profunda TaxID=398743 RepID=UPI00059EE7D6|nr:hypothetical protein [Zunongwangia profunda]MAO36117.1 hypothetical protein [Zunongwangia sp.]MAS70039.1 hypothetical protein [Zunongwangia sp.]MCC4229623.1 hypothetical protein [Zunongwangia profunda]|tara:strand:- start:124 stop:312 length:189 start_codon:yes stop_codon:yes gene_type:complete
MHKLSIKTKATALISLIFLAIGGFLLKEENNAFITIMIVSIIVVAGLSNQIFKERKLHAKSS